MKENAAGYTLVGLAMVLLVAGVIVLTVLPPVVGNLKTRALYTEKSAILGLRDTVLGFAMENCRLPTQNELQACAPQYGLGERTGYVVATSPVLTDASALKSLKAEAGTDLALRVPVQDGFEANVNLAFFVYTTGLNRREDLESEGMEYRIRVPGERFELDGQVHVYDDLVRYVTLEALCDKTGCCQ